MLHGDSNDYKGGIIGISNTETSTIQEIKLINCYNRGKISNAKYGIGGIIGAKYGTTKLTIKDCLYLTGTASSGIGATNDSTLTIESSDTLPDVLTVINGDNAFVADTKNINGGYPILAWQAPTNE